MSRRTTQPNSFTAPYTNLVPHPRTLALDVGDRRIGIAITDPLGLTAQPLFTLHRSSPKPNLRSDLKAIARFIRQHKVEAVLIGNPLHADGSPSPQSAKAMAFAEALQEATRQSHPNLAFHLLDERLTTHDAHALLSHSGFNPRASGHSTRLDRSAIIDQVAATLLLQSFLSTRTPTLLPDPDAP
ncbi:MAG: Holliday junction resolvase RuvX [Acidobacteria bacterium]|nr:Holliday junction resolvase RuvX [Acidobacteriota bacterium]